MIGKGSIFTTRSAFGRYTAIRIEELGGLDADL